MPFDPESERDIARLQSSIEWSDQKFRTFCEQHVDLVRQYVGYNHGEDAAPDRVPINLIELGVSVFHRQISIKSLSALVTSPYPQLEAAAADLELAVNYEASRKNVAASINAAGLSALFTMGVVKTGIAVDGGPEDSDGAWHDPGEFFADPVLVDDFIIDMTARRLDEVRYMGDRFRVPLEWARENPFFDYEARRRLTASPRGSVGREESTRTDTIQHGSGPSQDDYEDEVDLMEVWLPRQNLVLTLADGDFKRPLRIAEHKGPKHGPYRIFGLGDIPGNLLPLAPVRLWHDLHDITNRLFIKAARGAERRKTILGIQGHAQGDGSRVLHADDGQAIYMENPDGVREFTTGGADQTTLAMVIWCKQMLTYIGGNWDAIGGLAAQSQTLGQDRLLTETASERVKDMKDRMFQFAKGVLTDLAWYLWEDPLIELPLTKRVPGTDITVPVTWTPESKMGEFWHYNFDVDPYSAYSKSPSERVQVLSDLLTTFIIPAMPMLLESGVKLEWEKFFQLLSRYLQLPELNSILSYASGLPRELEDGPRMPPSTKRTYERINRPAATRQGQDQALMGMLLGGQSQPAETAALARPAT